MTYKKRGGLRFITLGCFGMCFYISRSPKKLAARQACRALREALRLKREATYAYALSEAKLLLQVSL